MSPATEEATRGGMVHIGGSSHKELWAKHGRGRGQETLRALRARGFGWGWP